MKLVHEIKDDANGFLHRLVPEGTDVADKQDSWVGYTAPACFWTTKGVFVAVTEYYRGSHEFPNPDKIYLIREAPESI